MDRFSPLKIKDIELKNRVVVPAMASQLANELGQPTEKHVEHYRKLASSGAGLVFVEYSFVHLSGRSEAHQLGADSDDNIAGLKKISDAIHDMGAYSGFQITHAGAKSERQYSGGALWGPSAIAVPAHRIELEVPDAVGKEEIQILKNSFLTAALRGIEAGFDFIEIHDAHGYGLNQWLSPITNQRDDEYGGSLENRARLLFEIVHEILLQSPEVRLSVRIPGQDLLPGGLSVENMIWVSKDLESLGVAMLNVSSGLGGWRRPVERRGQGYLVEEAIEIQKNVSIPVMGVGGITEGDFIDELVGENKISLAAVGRAILEDPTAWKKRVMS